MHSNLDECINKLERALDSLRESRKCLGYASHELYKHQRGTALLARAGSMGELADITWSLVFDLRRDLIELKELG